MATCAPGAGTCISCSRPLQTGLVGYPEVPGYEDDPAEFWTPPGSAFPISDDDGHPLTWGRVRLAHASLVAHASCEAAGGEAVGFDSDDEDAPGSSRPCPCQWHPAVIEELSSHASAVARWPGPICGSCWAASCACGYVLEGDGDAVGRDSQGRYVCHSPGCASRVVHAA